MSKYLYLEEKFASLEKYNFWNWDVPELGFMRKEYTDKIFDYTGNKLIKIFIGQRRVGKSYIFRQLAYRLNSEETNPENIFYINKEFTEFDAVQNYQTWKIYINFIQAILDCPEKYIYS